MSIPRIWAGCRFGQMSLLALCAAAPVWGAERIYLLEQQARGSAPYSFRSLGEIDGARRAAVPETGGHVLVLTSSGRVWGWGQNLHGQLGTGDRAARAGFVEIPGLSDITAIAAGAQHSIALKNDGTVWTWGANSEGQLGDGSLVNRVRPGIVPGLQDVSMIAAGALFTVVLKSDGTVWAFGSNWNGIAGADGRKLVTEPVRVEGLSDVRAVATRRGVGYALDGQGRIWVWGRGVENAAGTARVLSETQRELAVRLLAAGPRLSAEWLGTGIDGASGVLRMREGRASRTFAMEGTALDVAAGWAVAVIAGERASGTDGGAVDWSGSSILPPRQSTVMASLPGLKTASGGGTRQVVIGGYNTLSVRADGSVRVWGNNAGGVLGDGTAVERRRPVCALLSGIQELSASIFRTVALAQDSTVWAWGTGDNGALGDGVLKRHSRLVPYHIPSLSGVVSIAAASDSVLALKSDGTVWAWGSNDWGQLGDGTTNSKSTPQQVPGLTGITSIAAGSGHGLARRNDGVVFAWGVNGYGQLGDGTYEARLSPTQLTGFTAASVAASGGMSFAIRSDGTLWAWGNVPGLGTGSSKPAQFTGVSNVVQVSASSSLILFLNSDGTVWSIRTAENTGHSEVLLPPYLNQLALPMKATGVAAGWDHFAVVLSDGTVRLAGLNSSGALGRTDMTRSDVLVEPEADVSCTYSAPAPLVGPKGRIGAGVHHLAVVAEDGSVWASGDNSSGQIGNGVVGPDSKSPVKVPGLTGIVEVSAGFTHTLALGSDGLVRSWGGNAYGQLGDGSLTDHASPAIVPGLTSVTHISAGMYHSVALRKDGTVWCWGSNQYATLGDGSRTDRLMPTMVPNLQNVVEIAVGVTFTVVRKADGTVWRWGTLGNQLLDTPDALTPVQVQGLSDVVSIAAMGYAGAALRRDGTVWMWSDFDIAILGNGYTFGPLAGIARVDLTDVVSIGLGSASGMAVKADGTVWTWGENTGASGIPLLPGDPWAIFPTKVNVSGIASVTLGYDFTVAWARDGRLWVWGRNDHGQFGIAEPTVTRTPTLGGFQPGFPLASTPLSAVPVSGDSSVQSFDFGFRSAAGASTLRWAQMLFAAEWDGGGLPFCYLHYDVPGNGLWLYGESGYFVGPVAPGTASNLLQNSFCAVDPKKTTITKNGATLTVRAQVLFKQAAARKIFTRSLDFNDVDSGWIQEGTWDSTAVVMAAPRVSPNTGSGAAPTFVATFDDASGLPLSTGGWVQFLVAAAADGGGQPFCYLHYDRAGDGLWMYSGDVGFFLGPVKPGVSSTVLQSSACSINTAGTTVQNNAGQLVISSPFTLKSPMTGNKKLYQRSMDALKRDSGWMLTGTWIVP